MTKEQTNNSPEPTLLSGGNNGHDLGVVEGEDYGGWNKNGEASTFSSVYDQSG